MSDNIDKIDDTEDDFEKYCYLCRRPESLVGKLVHLLTTLMCVLIACKKPLIVLMVWI